MVIAMHLKKTWHGCTSDRRRGPGQFMLEKLGESNPYIASNTSSNAVNRYYASTRLRWNSIERCRGTLEDNLIDDLVEWSIWHYPSIRQ